MPQVRASERRRQIVEAAARVIASVGLEGATTRLIAAEAGVPLGTLHYVFKDKRAVLAGVHLHLVERDTALFEAAITDGCGLEHAVRIMTLDYLDHLLRDEPMMMANWEIRFWSARTPGNEGLATELYATYHEFCTAALQRAAAGTLSADGARPLVQFLFNAIDGVVLQYMAQRDPAAARNSLEILTAAAIKEFCPEDTLGQGVVTEHGHLRRVSHRGRPE
jgi:AcrR family transcriptional regulator